MPTGYTSKLYDGKRQTFAEFTLSCARAFGALVPMRDEPADADIPDEFQPDTQYSDRRLKESRALLVELDALTAAEAEARAWADYETQLNGFAKAQAERAAMRDRYEAMLEQVEAWEPPTSDHVGLKEFMVQQLRDSIKHDTEGYEQFMPKRLEAREWVEKQRQGALRTIVYSAGEREKEIERARSRSAWVKSLRESLEAVTVDA